MGDVVRDVITTTGKRQVMQQMCNYGTEVDGTSAFTSDGMYGFHLVHPLNHFDVVYRPRRAQLWKGLSLVVFEDMRTAVLSTDTLLYTYDANNTYYTGFHYQHLTHANACDKFLKYCGDKDPVDFLRPVMEKIIAKTTVPGSAIYQHRLDGSITQVTFEELLKNTVYDALMAVRRWCPLPYADNPRRVGSECSFWDKVNIRGCADEELSGDEIGEDDDQSPVLSGEDKEEDENQVPDLKGGVATRDLAKQVKMLKKSMYEAPSLPIPVVTPADALLGWGPFAAAIPMLAIPPPLVAVNAAVDAPVIVAPAIPAPSLVAPAIAAPSLVGNVAPAIPAPSLVAPALVAPAIAAPAILAPSLVWNAASTDASQTDADKIAATIASIASSAISARGTGGSSSSKDAAPSPSADKNAPTTGASASGSLTEETGKGTKSSNETAKDAVSSKEVGKGTSVADDSIDTAGESASASLPEETAKDDKTGKKATSHKKKAQKSTSVADHSIDTAGGPAKPKKDAPAPPAKKKRVGADSLITTGQDTLSIGRKRDRKQTEVRYPLEIAYVVYSSCNHREDDTCCHTTHKFIYSQSLCVLPAAGLLHV